MLAGWGSTYGVLREAVDRLDGEARLVQFRDIWPFPAEAAAEALRRWKACRGGEQLHRPIQAPAQSETCLHVDHSILRYDGRPFSPEDIVAGLKEVR